LHVMRKSGLSLTKRSATITR
jgi:quercetin dioxygenase-like cupin family protein